MADGNSQAGKKFDNILFPFSLNREEAKDNYKYLKMQHLLEKYSLHRRNIIFRDGAIGRTASLLICHFRFEITGANRVDGPANRT
jgi:hypothetical protein